LVKFYDIPYKELKREEYNQLEEKYHKNTIPFLKALGEKFYIIHGSGDAAEELKFQTLPYNPIEKD